MKPTTSRQALTLIEVVGAMIILSVLLIAVMNTVGATTTSQSKISYTTRAALLGQQLIQEILQQNYEDPDETPIFGRELSESGSNRSSFDDVDDYHNWAAKPPEYRDGTVMPDLQQWQREVTIEYVDPDDLTAVVGVDMGAKRIRVRVKGRDVELCSLVAIRTRAVP